MSISRRRTTRLAAAGLAAALTLTACGGGDSDEGSRAAGSSKENGDITVGVALPQSGGSAILGGPMLNAIKMAVEELNADGGIDGRRVLLSAEDTGADDNSALNAFNRLVSDDPAAVVGFPVSTQGFAVMTQVDRTRIPVIMSGTNAKLASGSDWAFNWIANDQTTSTAAVEFAAKKLGYDKIALLRESGELGTGAAKTVKAAAEKQGVVVVADEVFQTGEKDLSAQANKLRGGDAQMLFVYGQQADFLVVSNALATAGVKLPTLLAGLQPQTKAQLNNGGFETIYNRGQCVPSAVKDGKTAAWAGEYAAKFGSPPTEYAAVAYDGMKLLFAALSEAGTDPEALAKSLAQAPKTEGVCGVHKGGPEGNLSYTVTIGSYGADGSYMPAEVLDLAPSD